MADDRITIGAVAYTVEHVKDLREQTGGGFLYGDVSYPRARIRLDADLEPQIQRITLWHEVLHGILNGAAIEDHDEQVIDALAHGIVQVLRDNPQLRG